MKETPLAEMVEVALETFLLVFADTVDTSNTGAIGASRTVFSWVFRIDVGGNLADAVRRSRRGTSKYPVASSGAVVGLDDCCREVSESVFDRCLLPGTEDPREDRRSGITITRMLSFRFLAPSGAPFNPTSDATLPLLIVSGL